MSSFYRNVQAGPVLVISRDQQSYTERPTHDALLAFCTFAKTERQIAYRLCTAFYPQRLSVIESVVLALDSCVLNHAPCIGLEAGHGAADVTIDFDDFLNGRSLEEGGGNALLYTEDHTFTCGHLYYV